VTNYEHTCRLCGHTGRDVAWDVRSIDGTEYAVGWFCLNLADCKEHQEDAITSLEEK